jgi:hypothetical protein
MGASPKNGWYKVLMVRTNLETMPNPLFSKITTDKQSKPNKKPAAGFVRQRALT